MKSSPTSPMSAPVFTAVLGMVFVLALNLRWFIPAEDSADGATVWLAAFWCLAAVVSRFSPFADDAIARRWTRADCAVALLAGGHLLSGVLVLMLGGNRHNAAILIAEWLGIAAVWSILRDLVRVPGVRAAIWQSTLLSLTVIAVVGCWQHWVELPAMAQRLGPKFDAVRAGNAAARQELSRQGVPLTDPEFTLFEKRLRDSREPFAFFALANTLGGFLAAGLMLVIGDRLLGVSAPQTPTRNRTLWPRVLAGIALAICLLLTKSRTALLAFLLIAGSVSAIRIIGARIGFSMSRRVVGMAAGALAVVVVVGIVLSRSGSWDREVLTEATKSLSYRIHYWEGTARLIAEHPLLGGGLGQFRNAYLRVKAPEASEEIADPHNFLLDVWFHGGLLAAAGALWLVATVLMTSWKAVRVESEPSSTTALTVVSDPWFLLMSAVAPFGAFFVQYGGSGYWDDRLLVVGSIMIVAVGLIIYGRLTWSVPSRATSGFAALVLFTHLLGAGGIGYTTVMQFLLLCLAGTFSLTGDSEPKRAVNAVAVWLPCVFFGTALLAVLTVWRSDARSLVEAADQLVLHGAPAEKIRAAYTRAMQADPWDPLPCSRLAEFEFQQWQQELPSRNGHGSEMPSRLEAAVTTFGEALRRDPTNGQWAFRRGTMLQEGAERSKSPLAAELAVVSLDRAVNLYPTNAQWQAALSDAAALAGMTSLAEKAARKALAQDDVNQRFGHVERILAAEVRARLEVRSEPVAPN